MDTPEHSTAGVRVPTPANLTEYVQRLDELVESCVSVAMGLYAGRLDVVSGAIAVNQLLARWQVSHRAAERLNILTDTQIPEEVAVPCRSTFRQMMGRIERPARSDQPCQTPTPPTPSDTSCPSG